MARSSSLKQVQMVVSFPGVDISADASPSKEERKAARDARRAKNESIRARKSARKEAAESAETSAKVTKQEQGDVLEDLELAAIQPAPSKKRKAEDIEGAQGHEAASVLQAENAARNAARAAKRLALDVRRAGVAARATAVESTVTSAPLSDPKGKGKAKAIDSTGSASTSQTVPATERDSTYSAAAVSSPAVQSRRKRIQALRNPLISSSSASTSAAPVTSLPTPVAVKVSEVPAVPARTRSRKTTLPSFPIASSSNLDRQPSRHIPPPHPLTALQLFATFPHSSRRIYNSPIDPLFALHHLFSHFVRVDLVPAPQISPALSQLLPVAPAPMLEKQVSASAPSTSTLATVAPPLSTPATSTTNKRCAEPKDSRREKKLAKMSLALANDPAVSDALPSDAAEPAEMEEEVAGEGDITVGTVDLSQSTIEMKEKQAKRKDTKDAKRRLKKESKKAEKAAGLLSSSVDTAPVKLIAPIAALAAAASSDKEAGAIDIGSTSVAAFGGILAPVPSPALIEPVASTSTSSALPSLAASIEQPAPAVSAPLLRRPRLRAAPYPAQEDTESEIDFEEQLIPSYEDDELVSSNARSIPFSHTPAQLIMPIAQQSIEESDDVEDRRIEQEEQRDASDDESSVGADEVVVEEDGEETEAADLEEDRGRFNDNDDDDDDSSASENEVLKIDPIRSLLMKGSTTTAIGAAAAPAIAKVDQGREREILEEEEGNKIDQLLSTPELQASTPFQTASSSAAPRRHLKQSLIQIVPLEAVQEAVVHRSSRSQSNRLPSSPAKYNALHAIDEMAAQEEEVIAETLEGEVEAEQHQGTVESHIIPSQAGATLTDIGKLTGESFPASYQSCLAPSPTASPAPIRPFATLPQITAPTSTQRRTPLIIGGSDPTDSESTSSDDDDEDEEDDDDDDDEESFEGVAALSKKLIGRRKSTGALAAEAFAGSNRKKQVSTTTMSTWRSASSKKTAVAPSTRFDDSDDEFDQLASQSISKSSRSIAALLSDEDEDEQEGEQDASSVDGGSRTNGAEVAIEEEETVIPDSLDLASRPAADASADPTGVLAMERSGVAEGRIAIDGPVDELVDDADTDVEEPRASKSLQQQSTVDDDQYVLEEVEDGETEEESTRNSSSASSTRDTDEDVDSVNTLPGISHDDDDVDTVADLSTQSVNESDDRGEKEVITDSDEGAEALATPSRISSTFAIGSHGRGQKPSIDLPTSPMPVVSISPPTPEMLSSKGKFLSVARPSSTSTSASAVDLDVDSPTAAVAMMSSNKAKISEEHAMDATAGVTDGSLPKGGKTILRAIIPTSPSSITVTVDASKSTRASTRPTSSAPSASKPTNGFSIKSASSFVPADRNVGSWSTSVASPSSTALPARSKTPSMSQRASSMRSLSELALASTSTPARSTRSKTRPAQPESVEEDGTSHMSADGATASVVKGGLFHPELQQSQSLSLPQSRKMQQWTRGGSEDESDSDSDAVSDADVTATMTTVDGNGSKSRAKRNLWGM